MSVIVTNKTTSFQTTPFTPFPPKGSQAFLDFTEEHKKFFDARKSTFSLSGDDIDIVTPYKLFVDINRTDEYNETGSISRPFKSLASALAKSVSGTTIDIQRGTYVGNFVIPAGVSLINNSQNQVTLQGNVTFNGPGVPTSIKGVIFIGGTVTIDTSVSIYDCFSYSKVIFGINSNVTAFNFNIECNQADIIAVTVNSGNRIIFSASQMKSLGDAPAFVQTAGELVLNNSNVQVSAATLPAILLTGGILGMTSSRVINLAGATAIDLQLSAGAALHPNMLGGLASVGDIVCDDKHTVTDGLLLISGAITGTEITAL